MPKHKNNLIMQNGGVIVRLCRHFAEILLTRTSAKKANFFPYSSLPSSSASQASRFSSENSAEANSSSSVRAFCSSSWAT